jgi:HsdM N-terminal domain
MFEQAFRNIDDVLWKEAGCSSELDYTEQSSWLLFLKYLDDLEQDKSTEAALEGKKYTHILDKKGADSRRNSKKADLQTTQIADLQVTQNRCVVCRRRGIYRGITFQQVQV